MMARRLLPLLAVASLLVAGCSALDSINPFASSGPKMAPLVKLEPTVNVRELWSAGVGKAGNYTFTPAVVGNAVYVAARDGTVRKLVDGRTEWSIRAEQELSAGVGADSRLVVVGTAKGDVLAFSAADGQPQWTARVTSEILAAPAVGPDGVVVKSGDNRVVLLDTASGARKWIYQRSTPSLALRSTAPPVFADRFVFVGFPGGKLVALALENGAPVWEAPVASPKGATELDRVADIVSVPVIDGRMICAVAFQGRVACFDMAQGGTLLWGRDFSSASGLALDNRFLFVVDERGAVHALDRNSGGSVWKQDKLLHRRVSGPAVQRSVVAVADGEGIIHFLSREDGSFVARQKTDGAPVRTPVQTIGSGFLVQTTGGSVSAVEAQ
ncbi:MAG: outer membrane protein assembly factor BamB [Azonexus sp.]